MFDIQTKALSILKAFIDQGVVYIAVFIGFDIMVVDLFLKIRRRLLKTCKAFQPPAGMVSSRRGLRLLTASTANARNNLPLKYQAPGRAAR